MSRRYSRKSGKLWLGLGLGGLAGYVLTQQVWAIWQLINRDVELTLNTQTNETPAGRAFSETTETEVYTRSHTVEDGIERIVYLPKRRRFATPLVMQHGMWHGAWCWELWQELFAARATSSTLALKLDRTRLFGCGSRLRRVSTQGF